MYTKLALLLTLLGSAEPSAAHRATPQLAAFFQDTSALTVGERTKIVAAIIGFRQMVFWNDPTPLDGCSVSLAIGADYHSLLDSASRRSISQPTAACGSTPNTSSYPRRLVALGIDSTANGAIVRIIFRGGVHARGGV
jgi:hypothetical protein